MGLAGAGEVSPKFLAVSLRGPVLPDPRLAARPTKSTEAEPLPELLDWNLTLVELPRPSILDNSFSKTTSAQICSKSMYVMS